MKTFALEIAGVLKKLTLCCARNSKYVTILLPILTLNTVI